MRISDWSSDVCSSDLAATGKSLWKFDPEVPGERAVHACCDVVNRGVAVWGDKLFVGALDGRLIALDRKTGQELRSEEHTSELQSLMRISYAVFCLKTKTSTHGHRKTRVTTKCANHT